MTHSQIHACIVCYLIQMNVIKNKTDLLCECEMIWQK